MFLEKAINDLEMTKKEKRIAQLLSHPEYLSYKDIEWILTEH